MALLKRQKVADMFVITASTPAQNPVCWKNIFGRTQTNGRTPVFHADLLLKLRVTSTNTASHEHTFLNWKKMVDLLTYKELDQQ